MCAKHRIRPVALVRSLPDAVVSLRDHLRREDTENAMFYAEADHARLDDARLERMIARLAAPWYVNFYMSWRAAPDALIISYEELTADPKRIVSEILAYAGAAIDDRAIDKALATVRAKGESRLNVGVAGRGAGIAPETLRDLAALFDFYPEAADDPYVKGVRAQVAAAIEGRRPPPLGRVALRPVAARRPLAGSAPSRKARLASWVRRHGYQITLISIGILYWLWPEDLIPDYRWYGRIDDALLLTVAAFVAGRVTKRTPALRDLPKTLFRSLGRRLRLNA